MANLAHELKHFGKLYVNYTIMGKTGSSRVESLSMKALGKAKYIPFYMTLVFGSTTLLVMGLTGLIFTLALIGFEGTSSFSNTGLLASCILLAIGFGIKLAMFIAIRRKERKIRAYHDILKNFRGIKEIFLHTFTRELIREQNKMMGGEEMAQQLRPMINRALQ